MLEYFSQCLNYAPAPRETACLWRTVICSQLWSGSPELLPHPSSSDSGAEAAFSRKNGCQNLYFMFRRCFKVWFLFPTLVDGSCAAPVSSFLCFPCQPTSGSLDPWIPGPLDHRAPVIYCWLLLWAGSWDFCLLLFLLGCLILGAIFPFVSYRIKDFAFWTWFFGLGPLLHRGPHSAARHDGGRWGQSVTEA